MDFKSKFNILMCPTAGKNCFPNIILKAKLNKIFLTITENTEFSEEREHKRGETIIFDEKETPVKVEHLCGR